MNQKSTQGSHPGEVRDGIASGMKYILNTTGPHKRVLHAAWRDLISRQSRRLARADPFNQKQY